MEWSHVLVALISAGAAVAVQAWRSRSEEPANYAKTTADLFGQLTAVRERLLLTEESLARELHERKSAEQAMAFLRERLAVMEAAFPAAMLAGNLSALRADLLAVLDTLGPCVISRPYEGGQIVWASKAFAAGLGMTPEAVVEQGWQGLIHPADLTRTQAVEARAWHESVVVVNRFRHADGHYVTCRWVSMAYDGVALASAQMTDHDGWRT